MVGMGGRQQEPQPVLAEKAAPTLPPSVLAEKAAPIELELGPRQGSTPRRSRIDVYKAL